MDFLKAKATNLKGQKCSSCCLLFSQDDLDELSQIKWASNSFWVKICTESQHHLTNTLKNLIQSSSASQSPAQNFYIILRNRLSQIPRYCNGHFRISSFSVCLKPVPLSKFCTHTFITSSMSYINGFCPKLASTTSPGVWSPTVGYKFGCAKNKQREENYV